MEEKIIGISADHAGYSLKEELKNYLQKKGYQLEDYGAYEDDSLDDYPDFGHPLGEAINNGKIKRGISFCGAGNGINIVANKYPHVRSALCWKPEIAVLARKHNNANICSIPARFVDFDEAIHIIEKFFDTKFEGDRHQRRIDKIPIKS